VKLHIFQSDKGDCLLLQSKKGANVLCDGGMANAMRRHVRGQLAKLLGKRPLDVVYVSHIDQDHISGVLQLLEDALEWRVHDYHKKKGNHGVSKPQVPRPPAIGGLWHNAFRDQVPDNAGAIEDLLAAAAPAFFAAGTRDLKRIGQEALDIVLSIPEALRVSRLVKSDLLGIPLNHIPGSTGPAKLLLARDPTTQFRVGQDLDVTIVGPSFAHMRNLRKGWNNWLETNKQTVRELREEMQRRVEEFSTGARTTTPFDLHDWNGIPPVKGVTTPNVASLVLLVREGERSVLLTGDVQQDVLIDGLTGTGNLKDDYLHVDVLKVQHHGSEHNADKDFCKQVSADHYVFCGDGSDGNPELEVLELFYQSRRGSADRRALAPIAADRRFTFWFSTDSSTVAAKNRTAFRRVEKLVQGMVNKSQGKMAARFNSGAYHTLSL
jgi:beta-lactamase superfamily II metal-dependent hydrolase